MAGARSAAWASAERETLSRWPSLPAFDCERLGTAALAGIVADQRPLEFLDADADGAGHGNGEATVLSRDGGGLVELGKTAGDEGARLRGDMQRAQALPTNHARALTHSIP